MHVLVYGLDRQGKKRLHGVIRQEGKTLRAEPDSPLLRRLLARPLWTAEGEVTADGEPERFLEALHQTYRGSYLWVTPPQEDGPQERERRGDELEKHVEARVGEQLPQAGPGAGAPQEAVSAEPTGVTA
jgi:hypothetical protein